MRDTLKHMDAHGIVSALAADLAALQAGGLADAARANIYRSLLTLGTAAIDERASLVDEAIAAADADGALHLRIISRFIALSHVPEIQRVLARELSVLLGRDGHA
ncbi:MAG: hypothetical protein NVSMB5_04740 [Candidatus Velthaea sp.]